MSEEIWSRRTPFITDLESSLCSWWFAQGSSSFCARLWTTCLWSSFVVQAVTLQRGRLPQCSWGLHWLILAPALERIKKRWEDARGYFLVHVINKPKYKKVLPQNKKFLQIAGALTHDTNWLLQMSFLIWMASIITGFLTVFQGEGPLSHILFMDFKECSLLLWWDFLRQKL